MRRGPALAVLLAAVLTIAACSSGDSGSNSGSGDRSPDSVTTVNFATVPVLTVGPLYLGIKRGFFADEGLDVKTQTIQNGAAITAAMTSGDVQFASSALAPTIVAASKGLPLQLVTTTASVGPPDSQTAPYGDAVLMVKKGAPFHSVQDLAGRTIVVNALNAGLELVVKATFDRLGVDPDSLKFLVVPFPDMATALDGGQVDAIAVVDPFVSDNKQRADVLQDLYPYDPGTGKQFLSSVYYTTSSYAKSHHDIVEKFAAAMGKAQAYGSAHPDEVRQVIPTYTGLSASVVGGLALPEFPEKFSTDDYDSEVDLMLKYGLIKEKPPAGFLPS